METGLPGQNEQAARTPGNREPGLEKNVEDRRGKILGEIWKLPQVPPEDQHRQRNESLKQMSENLALSGNTATLFQVLGQDAGTFQQFYVEIPWNSCDCRN